MKKKYLIITGGSGFIGAELVKFFLNKKYFIFVIDKKELKVAAKFKKNFKFFKCDITNEKQLLSINKKILKFTKSIDAVINNAGFTTNSNLKSKNNFFNIFEKTNFSVWDQVMSTNVRSVAIVCKVFGQLMKNKNGGSIVNIASDVGVISPNYDIYKNSNFNLPISYAVSKAAVIHLSKCLAVYWAKNKIRVNSISPAGIYNNHKKEFVDKLSNLIPMKRMMKISEITGAVEYLISKKSTFVTGQNIILDGGRTSW